jgi:hypothetical protein
MAAAAFTPRPARLTPAGCTCPTGCIARRNERKITSEARSGGVTSAGEENGINRHETQSLRAAAAWRRALFAAATALRVAARLPRLHRPHAVQRLRIATTLPSILRRIAICRTAVAACTYRSLGLLWPYRRRGVRPSLSIRPVTYIKRDAQAAGGRRRRSRRQQRRARQ